MKYLTHFLRHGVKIIAKIDHEYACVWVDEFNYLTKHGIKYTFVKIIDGVTVWKFKKNSTLFNKLAEFYKNVYSK